MAIKDINFLWKKYITTTEDHTLDLLRILGREFVGNLIDAKHKNKRICIVHKHDTLLEILTLSWDHEVTKRMSHKIRVLLENWKGSRSLDGGTPVKYDTFPLGIKIIDIQKLTSRMIRQVINQNSSDISTKMIGVTNPDTRNKMGNLIKSMNNVKLKTILLRVIHGDIYCGTRLKKFGMTESNLCSRCGKEETIEHMLLTCNYVKKIWDKISKITGITFDSVGSVVGQNPLHDKTTITITSEIIRQLLAIERPNLDPSELTKNTIKRLSIVEKGITKIQIDRFLIELNKI